MQKTFLDEMTNTINNRKHLSLDQSKLLLKNSSKIDNRQLPLYLNKRKLLKHYFFLSFGGEKDQKQCVHFLQTNLQ